MQEKLSAPKLLLYQDVFKPIGTTNRSVYPISTIPITYNNHDYDLPIEVVPQAYGFKFLADVHGVLQNGKRKKWAYRSDKAT